MILSSLQPQVVYMETVLIEVDNLIFFPTNEPSSTPYVRMQKARALLAEDRFKNLHRDSAL